MKVQCISNTTELLPQALFELNPGLKTEVILPIQIEKEYLVYALEIYCNYSFYFICDEERDCNAPCPFWNPYPAELFKITDGRISRYWRFNNYQNKDVQYNKAIFAIPKWAEEPVSFYTKFIDRNQVEVEYFKKYKKLMDLEFPNSSVIKVASDLGKSWIMCPDCDEAWENKSSAALVECPKCKTLLNNPYQPTE